MPGTDDEIERQNPDEGGPYRLGKLIGRNKRKVTPDANLLTVINIQESPGYLATFRRWFLRHHGPIWMLIFAVLIASYEIPHYYDPGLTNIVMGIVFGTVFGALIPAWEWEKRQDQHHNVFVDLIQIKLKETTVARVKEGDKVESRVIQPEVTERAIYLAKDYMFEGDDAQTIKKYNAQIVGTFGKILDVSSVDSTGRILIGEGEGDLPSGMIVKIAYPSRTQLTKEVKKADEARRNGAVSEKQFLEFKAAVDEYNLWQKHVIKLAERTGITMIDIDKMSKQQRSFFVALDQYSTQYWTGVNRNDPLTLKDWKEMTPSIALPKILKYVQEYNEVKNERLDLLVNRESDKMEAELGATMNLIEMTGRSKEAMKQFLVEQRKGLVSVVSKTEEDTEREASGREE